MFCLLLVLFRPIGFGTKKLLGAKGFATRSKDATRGAPGLTSSKKLVRLTVDHVVFIPSVCALCTRRAGSIADGHWRHARGTFKTITIDHLACTFHRTNDKLYSQPLHASLHFYYVRLRTCR